MAQYSSGTFENSGVLMSQKAPENYPRKLGKVSGEGPAQAPWEPSEQLKIGIRNVWLDTEQHIHQAAVYTCFVKATPTTTAFSL